MELSSVKKTAFFVSLFGVLGMALGGSIATVIGFTLVWDIESILYCSVGLGALLSLILSVRSAKRHQLLDSVVATKKVVASVILVAISSAGVLNVVGDATMAISESNALVFFNILCLWLTAFVSFLVLYPLNRWVFGRKS